METLHVITASEPVFYGLSDMPKEFQKAMDNTKNLDNESNSTEEEDIHFITSDSESETGILKTLRTSHQHPIPKVSPREHSSPAKHIISVPKLISIKKPDVINTPSGKIKRLQVTLRVNKSLFKATVDMDSPASFVNENTADLLLRTRKNVKMYPKSSLPIDISYVDCNHKPIELFGTLVTDISSLGWKIKSTQFLISENRTRCLLGLDLGLVEVQ